MRLLVTGGTSVLGRALAPPARAAGHELRTPGRAELDLFDRAAVIDATGAVDAVLHLATRIRPLEELEDREAWCENDRLRAVASRILVDAALAREPSGRVRAAHGPVRLSIARPGLRSDADHTSGDPPIRAYRRARDRAVRPRRTAGSRAPPRPPRRSGTGHEQPRPGLRATLHVADAARALLPALTLPSGIYNVCRDGERVSNRRFTRAAGWHPQR